MNSIWLNQAQVVFHVLGKHYQVGENPELCVIFYCLTCFRKLPIQLIFVFNGEGCPLIKQGINVCTKAHDLASSFQEMITSYGYDFHVVSTVHIYPSAHTEHNFRPPLGQKQSWRCSTLMESLMQSYWWCGHTHFWSNSHHPKVRAAPLLCIPSLTDI